jgi:hypothetical protein
MISVEDRLERFLRRMMGEEDAGINENTEEKPARINR